MHAGIKQSRVVFLVHDIREFLRMDFDTIMSRPAPEKRFRTIAEARSDDSRVFAVFRNVDMAKELWMSDQPGVRLKFKEPDFCSGIESLAGALNRMGDGYHQAIVMELAHMAHGLKQALKQAPIAKRGRQ